VFYMKLFNFGGYAENANQEIVFAFNNQRFRCKCPQKYWSQKEATILYKFPFHGSACTKASSWDAILQVDFFSALIVGINAYLMDLVFSWCLYACAVCSLHIILRLFFIAWMNFKRKMRMEYRLCFTSRKYIQVLRVLCCDD
jgi:hypothetical protein